MTSNPFEPYGLPTDVVTAPNGLVAMLGLDVDKKPIHKAVWEAFAENRRSDRTPLSFVLLNEDYKLPPSKQKRPSYEWYVPKGILKANWLNKYLKEIPGVFVIFCDLDWNDSEWLEKKNQLAAKVQTIRTEIDNRGCRIALVLIQSGISVPGEDTGAAEKAATLCTTCDLLAKHLFVLPHSDTHLLGYAVRLENALSEIVGGFYMAEVKTVRSHKDYLNKTSHQLLFVRHNFKLGFHNEMRNDHQSAVKHYGQSYQHLVDLRCTDTNLHEIRVVAAIINYKICRLDFVLNLPRDAIAQFRKHIDMFRQKTGPKDLIFEHYAWLSKQYQIFGDIFEEAVRTGLPAVQTQHPGFYYQQAAQYAVLRRNTAQQVCKDLTSGTMDLLNGWSDLEFYGQRPWRPGKHILEPPEAEREGSGIKALQYNEIKEVNHANSIIPLFSSAISQFKKYRCPRIKRHLMIQMAEEYDRNHDPVKALALLNHVMWDYRSEKWWTLLSSSSFVALRCAYQTVAVTEYVALSLEVMGPRIIAEHSQKSTAHSNLLKVINCQVPDPEAGTSSMAIATATDSWSALFHGQVSPITVDMTSIVPCLEVRASFLAMTSHVDEEVNINFKIRNSFTKPLQLSRVAVGTNCPAYNDSLIFTNMDYLNIDPNKHTDLTLTFQPSVNDVGNIIKMTSVSVQLGTTDKIPITLQWSGVGNEGVTSHTGNAPSYKEFGLLCKDQFDTVNIIPEIQILRRKPIIDITLDYDETSLVWEWLPVSIIISNEELSTASDIYISLCLDQSSDVTLEQTTQISTAVHLDSKKCLPQLHNHKVSNLLPGTKAKHILYIKSLTATKRNFSITVNYNSLVKLKGSEVNCPSVFNKTFTIIANIPFSVSIETQSLKFESISTVASEESFLIVPRINCISHVPIILTSSSLTLAGGVVYDGETMSQVAGSEVSNEEVAFDCFCVKAKPDSADHLPIPLGQYLLNWKRDDDHGAPSVSVSVGLPSIVVQSWGIWVEAEVPAQGVVRTPMPITYTIVNRAAHTVELAITMQVSDAFMFSGNKEMRVRVLSGSREEVSYVLYPLLAGMVHLPKLNLTMESPLPHGQPTAFEALLSRVLPTHVYIMPQAKVDGVPISAAIVGVSEMSLVSQA